MVPDANDVGPTDGSVIGGGPGAVPPQTTRLEKQLPDFANFPGLYTIKDTTALKYVDKLANYLAKDDPEIGDYVKVIETAVNCGVSSGFVGARFYIAHDLESVSAFLLVTIPSLADATAAVLKCLAVPLLGGGPGANGAPDFAPSFESFDYPAYYDGVEVTYHGMVLATDSRSTSSNDAPNCNSMVQFLTNQGYRVTNLRST